MKIYSYAMATEAARCIAALDRIESAVIERAQNDLAEIALAHPDVGGVVDSIIGSLTDGIGDSGLHAMKRQLRDAVDDWEGKAA